MAPPLPHDAALERIRVVWLAWAKHELDPAEAMAQLAELLEEAGFPLIATDEAER